MIEIDSPHYVILEIIFKLSPIFSYLNISVLDFFYLLTSITSFLLGPTDFLYIFSLTATPLIKI